VTDDRTIIKTTVEMERDVWTLARVVSLEWDMRITEYVKRLILLADRDPEVKARALALDA
jgi:hypothetical protein